MVDFDLEYLDDELDDLGMVLALKMIELRIYTDISYTEDELKEIDDDILREEKGSIFLNKIKWFKEWVDMKNLKLMNAGLTDLDEMGIDDLLNTIIVNDSLGFKRRKVFETSCSTPIYIHEEEDIVHEDPGVFEYYKYNMKNKLGL